MAFIGLWAFDFSSIQMLRCQVFGIERAFQRFQSLLSFVVVNSQYLLIQFKERNRLLSGFFKFLKYSIVENTFNCYSLII